MKIQLQNSIGSLCLFSCVLVLLFTKTQKLAHVHATEKYAHYEIIYACLVCVIRVYYELQCASRVRGKCVYLFIFEFDDIPFQHHWQFAPLRLFHIKLILNKAAS